jgi:hypothetical protein
MPGYAVLDLTPLLLSRCFNAGSGLKQAKLDELHETDITLMK